MRFSIVGQKHRNLDPYLPGIAAGSEALLVREPENPHDAFAIAVYVGDKKVGFLSKRDNVELSKRIDADGLWFAETFAILGIAVDAGVSTANAKMMRATFVRSPNSAYPQVEIDLERKI